MFKEPDYSSYGLEELYQALDGIDKERYSERYQKIQKQIKERAANPTERDLEFLEEMRKREKEWQKYKRNWKRPIATGAYMVVIGLTGFYSGVIYIRHGQITYGENPGLFVAYLLILLGVGGHLLIEGIDRWGRYKNKK